MRVSWNILTAFLLSQFALLLGINAFPTGSEKDLTPTAARNMRATIRYQYVKANEAQNKMSIAENNNDVDSYAHWLKVMREADAKINKLSVDYYELRDYLEAKIWTGEMEIKNFNKIHEKSTAASILDHLLFRAKY